jgi:hypothetical protein
MEIADAGRPEWVSIRLDKTRFDPDRCRVLLDFGSEFKWV